MSTDALFAAAGTLRRSYEDVDWAATPVGPPPSWSPALRNAADLALHTQFPVTLFWGPEFILIYNEAYVPLIADKHPAALGAAASDVFPEAWDTIGPMMRGVLAGEGATWVEDLSVPLVRHGFLEEAYFTFSYSPVRDAGGAVAGVMDIATETTRQVLYRRRLEMLGRLRDALGDLEHARQVGERALPVLRANAEDLPAVDIRLADAPAPAVVGAPGADRVARFPLGSAQTLVVRLSDRLAPDTAYFSFLRLIASLLGQAIDRVHAREVEHAIVEALQRSLLTQPAQPDHVDVAVRYLPAAEAAQIGGDWYDAFVGPGGELTLVTGDVTGHDLRAATAMAQVRNLLRGVSYTMQASPAGVLCALDKAMRGLSVDLYATAVLARVEQDDADVARGLRTLRWSNAGHPPPVYIAPDGRTRLLETPPDALLGLGDGRRADHAISLEPGSTVVLYTDGLVERRRIPLQERLEWLARVLEDGQRLDAEALCDHVLAQLEHTAEDDIALLVVRFNPEG